MIPPPPTEAEKRRWLREAKKRRKIGPYVAWDIRRYEPLLPRCADGCTRVVASSGTRCYMCADAARVRHATERRRKEREARKAAK